MNFSKGKLFLIIVNRSVIFFFIMCVFTLFLYAAGTVQGFIDSTQFSLLSFYMAMGVLLALASMLSAFLEFGHFMRIKKKRYLFRAAGYMLLVIAAVASVLSVMFIDIISRGNGV